MKLLSGTLLLVVAVSTSLAQAHGEHWMAPADAAARKNPLKADATSLARGKSLFATHCASCHGDAGKGDGPAAAALNPKPADLAIMGGHHEPGDLAWKIANGRGAMPGWKGTLAEQDIWNLVNYVRKLARH